MIRYLVNEMKRYLTLVSDASEEEISELKAWVDAGNSCFRGGNLRFERMGSRGKQPIR